MSQRVPCRAKPMRPSMNLNDELVNMNSGSSILRRFLVVGTTTPMVNFGEHVSKCQAYSSPEPGKSHKEESLFTWLPDHRVHILLLQLPHNVSVVYVCELGDFFFSSEVTKLPTSTPAGTILAAVYTEDLIETNHVPRVLVHDVLYWGTGFDSSGCYFAENLTAIKSCERYRIIREEFNSLLNQSIQKTFTVVQWVGYLNAAKKFLPQEDGSHIKVGHKVKGLLALHDDSALTPSLVIESDAMNAP